MMRLTAHADKPIDQLSGGQRQRVALARALAVQPRVLLLDEPLTALDARLRDTLRSEMNTLLRELGITTVYVTHDQAEAMELGDRIVVMSAGRIEQIGSPRDIYYRPANRTVAQFVGTINRLAGETRDGMLTTHGGAVPLPSPLNTNIAATSDARRTKFFSAPKTRFSPIRRTRNCAAASKARAFLGERTRLDDRRRRAGCVARRRRRPRRTGARHAGRHLDRAGRADCAMVMNAALLLSALKQGLSHAAGSN